MFNDQKEEDVFVGGENHEGIRSICKTRHTEGGSPYRGQSRMIYSAFTGTRLHGGLISDVLYHTLTLAPSLSSSQKNRVWRGMGNARRK